MFKLVPLLLTVLAATSGDHLATKKSLTLAAIKKMVAGAEAEAEKRRSK